MRRSFLALCALLTAAAIAACGGGGGGAGDDGGLADGGDADPFNNGGKQITSLTVDPPTAAITILVPLLLPIATQLGVDPVHFGLVMVLNLMIGLLHPPMGMVLFVLARAAERTTMAILPWLFPLLASLIILTYVPQIGLWLPKVMGF